VTQKIPKPKEEKEIIMEPKYVSARRIQKMIRAMLARCRVRRRKIHVQKRQMAAGRIIQWAATLIQKIVRSKLGRIKFERLATKKRVLFHLLYFRIFYVF